MTSLFTRLIADDRGQDLVEYALLTGAIGFGSIAALELMGAAISGTYVSWGSAINALWEPPNPG